MDDSSGEIKIFSMGRRSIPVPRWNGSIVQVASAVFVSPPRDYGEMDSLPSGMPPFQESAQVELLRRQSNICLAAKKDGRSYRVEYIDEGFEQVTGFSLEELQGTDLSKLLNGYSLDRHNRHMSDHFSEASEDDYYVFIGSAPTPSEIPAKPSPEGFYYAFISYKRATSLSFCHKIVRFLFEAKLPVWFDKEAIPVGMDFKPLLEEGVAASDKFIFFLTAEYLESPHCRSELESAIALNKPILPVIQQNDSEIIAKLQAEYPSVGQRNFLFFDEKTENKGEAFQIIVDFVKADHSYFRNCTRYLKIARRWKAGNTGSLFDFRNEVDIALAFLKTNGGKADGVAPDVNDFIKAATWNARGGRWLAIWTGFSTVAVFLGILVLMAVDRRQLTRRLQDSQFESQIEHALSLSNYARILAAESDAARRERNDLTASREQCAAIETARRALTQGSEVMNEAQTFYNNKKDYAAELELNTFSSKWRHILKNVDWVVSRDGSIRSINALSQKLDESAKGNSCN